MTDAQSAENRDPLRDWLALRLEQLGSEEGPPTSLHGSAEPSIWGAAQRAERCAEVLSAVWPDRNGPALPDASAAAPPQWDWEGSPEGGGPSTLGRFQIQHLLGRGGMGTVFLAFDPTLARPVALKIPRFDLAGDPELRDRFLREARAAAKLSHPHLVEVYDAGWDGGMCYIASEYCDGPDLAVWLAAQDGPVEAELAAGLVARLAEAIHCCHQVGIVHRDLKPANILLTTAPGHHQAVAQIGMPFVAKITDFGLARMLEESLVQTRSSLIVGTPLYMAPEQAEGRLDEIGPATDVFALGVILYELLTGCRPFEGRAALTVLSRIQREEPVSPGRLRAGLPAGLDAICMKCLRKVPGERYASAADLAADLENWRNGRPISARRFTLWDRFRTWSRQPERVRDAGVVALGWNGVIACTLFVHIITHVFGFETPVPTSTRLLIECLCVMGVHSVFSWVGWRIMQGDRWAYRVGFAAAVALWFGVVNGLLGGAAMFQNYEDLPEAKYLMMLLFTLISTVQLLAFLVALRAPTSE
jgi:eukaryotic-like serine/threonine-protein kinase